MPHECLRSEYVKCGKKGCKSCPHGPYWYAYWWADGKTHKRYVGKDTTRDFAQERRLDEIHDRRKASYAVACEILGLRENCTKEECNQAFRAQSKIHHPDRGGTQSAMSRINAAYEYIRTMMRWS